MPTHNMASCRFPQDNSRASGKRQGSCVRKLPARTNEANLECTAIITPAETNPCSFASRSGKNVVRKHKATLTVEGRLHVCPYVRVCLRTASSNQSNENHGTTAGTIIRTVNQPRRDREGEHTDSSASVVPVVRGATQDNNNVENTAIIERDTRCVGSHMGGVWCFRLP